MYQSDGKHGMPVVHCSRVQLYKVPAVQLVCCTPCSLQHCDVVALGGVASSCVAVWRNFVGCTLMLTTFVVVREILQHACMVDVGMALL
jgi:hypothetical protein